jgi:hypothetical protein
MKYLLIFLFSMSAYSETSFLAGSITYHFLDYANTNEQFSNKIGYGGSLIANPLFAYRQTEYEENETYSALMLFGGENSIGNPMGGAALSIGLHDESWKVGFIAGSYLQNDQQFADKNIDNLDVHLGNVVGLAVIIGMEFLYNIPGTSLFLYDVITPTLTTLSLGMKF